MTHTDPKRERSAETAEAKLKNRPRPFDLSNPDELKRLLREIAGYVQAGAFIYKEGTDGLGRRYAAAALYDALSQGYTLAKPEPFPAPTAEQGEG